MDTLLYNDDGSIIFGDSGGSTHNVLTTQETLAFLYAGSGTETTYTWDAEGVTYADILVVGGGGGGRSSSGYSPTGGGGGGEVVYRQGVPVTPGVEIKVGRGGPVATRGGISQFTSSIQANGGGAGGSGSGGSGGGANRNVTTGGASVKLSVDGMGNVGGVSRSGVVGAAGGGGATQAGFNVTGSSGSNGGEGYAVNVFGVWNTVYGSGGGGGDRAGNGGLGGTNAGNGGKHDAADKSGTPGVAHTGSGGGGAGAENGGGSGGLGGSGIVLVKPNPGALDGLGSSVYTQAVGAYALRRLFGAYTGPQVRLRRSTDNEETDVTFDKYGNVEGLDLGEWLGAGTGYVVTWYDQSSGANHVTQTTATSQPFIVTSGDKPHIRFQSKIMTGPNVFGTSTITNMHAIFASRENVRSNNYFVSLNGTNTGNPGRFFIHAPYGNGTWYWDPGSVSTDRAYGATSTLGAKTVFSGYKSTTNGFRLDGGTRYLSSGSTTATVTGGVRIGEGAIDHSIYELLIFSSQLSDSIESFIEQNM
jgi:hypothetical protein